MSMKSARFGRYFERFLSTVGVGLVVLAVAWGFSAWRADSGVFAPLGPYPIQTVMSDTQFEGKPSFTLDEPVMVEGTKCSDAAIQVFGTVVWGRDNPSGLSLTTAQGTRFAEVGCVTQQYTNQIPAAVAAAVAESAERGDNETTWRISAVETPIDSETGRNGETATWTTDPFVLLARG